MAFERLSQHRPDLFNYVQVTSSSEKKMCGEEQIFHDIWRLKLDNLLRSL